MSAEMEKECPKSSLSDVLSGTLPEILEDDISPEVFVGEEMIEEIMRELYEEITCPPPPPSCTVPPLSSSESYGASVSDSASSVMAGVEFAGKISESTTGMMKGEQGVDEWPDRVKNWVWVPQGGGANGRM